MIAPSSSQTSYEIIADGGGHIVLSALGLLHAGPAGAALAEDGAPAYFGRVAAAAIDVGGALRLGAVPDDGCHAGTAGGLMTGAVTLDASLMGK